MAMLAEPKRKIRYPVNPSGRDWRENGDSSKFGQRMLHSMGWQEGLGLGKTCQGAVEPIKVRQKNDQRGVGCSGAYAAETMPQSDDFASLLSQLNQEYSGGGGSCHDNTVGSAVGLEAKSRASRARLHYHRFTRGKDVSAYGKDALACIFGTRTEPNKDASRNGSAETIMKDEDSNDAADDESPVTFGFGFQSGKKLAHSSSEACLTANPVSNNGLHLVQSQTSLQDYFRMKMLERKVKLEQQQQQEQLEQKQTDLNEQADSQSSWTSESSCSAASTLSGCNEDASQQPDPMPKPAKRVCFSVSPAEQADPEADLIKQDVVANDCNKNDDMLVLDFDRFPGSQLQRVLGYAYY